jgi:hypothetical protein
LNYIKQINDALGLKGKDRRDASTQLKNLLADQQRQVL